MKVDAYSVALGALFLILLVAVLLILFPAAETPPAPPQEPVPPSPQLPSANETSLYSPPSCEQISSCTPGDGCCPDSCTPLIDYDCQASELGETVSIDGVELKITFLEERRCIGFSDNEDYIYYLVFRAEFMNSLNRSTFISYPSFYLLDTEGNKHEPDPVLPHYVCRDNYQDLLLETKYIGAGQITSGEIWIEIDKEKDPLEGILRIVYDPIPSSRGEEYVFSFEY